MTLVALQWSRSALAARRRVGVGTARPTVDVTTVWTTAKVRCLPSIPPLPVLPTGRCGQDHPDPDGRPGRCDPHANQDKVRGIGIFS